jgi:L-ascorbate metabolism protein UlaG (beta-lactamase superfamily)
VPVGGGSLLRRLGFANATELRVGEEARIARADVRAVPAVHDGRRHPLGPIAEAIGFVVAGARRVHVAGDTDVFDGMAQATAPLDAALLPQARGLLGAQGGCARAPAAARLSGGADPRSTHGPARWPLPPLPGRVAAMPQRHRLA